MQGVGSRFGWRRFPAVLGAILVLFLWSFSPLPGRAEEAKKPNKTGAFAAPGSQECSLEHAKVKRTYRLHLPRDFVPGRPVPLVIALHGLGADGKIMAVLTGFSSLADRKGFAVAYPDGLNRMWRFWGDEDVGFLKALIEQLVQAGVVEARRVYVTGISNGAYMTNRLACDLTDRVAAVAPVAGTMVKGYSELARPTRPLPVLYIHGTEDTFVGYEGKDFLTRHGMSLGAESMGRWWARHNGCDPEPAVEKLPGKAKDGLTVERHSYRPGKAGAEVVLYKVVGGGHTWPGGSFQPEFFLGKTCRSFNASEVMWDFFARVQAP